MLPKFGGELAIFITAAVMAILVWLTGFIGSVALKDVAQPSPATLTFTLVGALIGAALTLVPGVQEAVAGVIRGVPRDAYPLVGAVIGYAIKK
jgi:Na+-driven multidrug efflux pump